MTKIQIFQLSQFALLALIALTVFLFIRNTNKSKSQFGVTEADLWEQKKKDVLSKGPSPQNKTVVHKLSDGTRSPPAEKAEQRTQIGVTFPTWKESTPPHDILGVSPQAPMEVIEAAYKSLLKKYHPDRFHSWGGDYEDKAHIVVFKLQKARDELLKKRL